MKNKKLQKVLWGIASASFWIIVWIIAAKAANSGLILPTPFSVIKSLGKLLSQGETYKVIALSLGRIAAGAISGILLGTVLGVASSLLLPADVILDPAVKIIRTTPVASFIILAMLWIGKESMPSFISALMVFPVIFLNMKTAVKEIPKDHKELCRVFALPLSDRLFKIYIPDVLPYFSSSAKTSIGLAWKAGVAAEIMSFSPDSIGRKITEAKNLLETEELFAWTATVIILSIIIEILLTKLIDVLSDRKRNTRNAEA